MLDDGLVNGHLNELRNIFVSTKSQDFKLLEIPRISVFPENGEGLLNRTVIGNQTKDSTDNQCDRQTLPLGVEAI